MTIDELKAGITGDVFEPADAGYRDALAGFNLALLHTPRVVVIASGADDIVYAVHFARAAGMRVSVQATGHGENAVTDGVLIVTRKLDAVFVNPISRIAEIGAGTRWQQVVDAAARYGLMPVTGSAPNVGAVGYLLGGGLGPLARSHGFSSDYVTAFKVITSNGDLVTASNDSHADLFWALRGGKSGLGIVTEVSVRLVAMKTLYAGSLTFAEPDIATVLRSWLRWTHTAHPQVTTSVGIVNFPNIDALPESIRGKRMLNLRFAFPGESSFGAELAAPLRAFAAAIVDTIDEMPAKDMGRIHSDPTDARPAWVTGMMFDHADDDFANALLETFGAGTQSPFFVAELRHIGQATSSDVTEGSAVAGRSASYAFGAVAGNPSLFETIAPRSAVALAEKLIGWRAREGNPNFAGQHASHDAHLRLWPVDVRTRLEAVRAQYDPGGMFAPTYSAANV